ncbi:ester cyclase [Kribbella catacumbae]|uniref:ester cyclase n=1 Tax=Kribbella catacumbae TaxID=460086 RepID=UPI00035F7106|nr:ester cyclase [Kribbella catacumbae]
MGTNVEVLQRYLQSIDQHDEDGVRRAFAESAQVRAPGVALNDVGEIASWIGVFWRAFPDLRHEILGSVEADGTAAAEVRFTGTHTGPLASPDGDIPATGKPFDFTYTHFTRFSDGVIAEDHVHFDQLTFLTQLGLAG